MSTTTFVAATVGSDGKAVAATQVSTAADTALGLEPKQLVRHLRHLSTDQFKKQLGLLADEVLELKRLALEVGKRGTATMKNGSKVGRKELTALATQHNKKLRSLGQNYQARGTRRKSKTKKDGTAKKKAESLFSATWINEDLRNFFAAANYGDRNAEVQGIIRPFLEKGYISRAMMAPLLGMYNKLHRYTVEEANGKIRTYLKADPIMRQYLGSYITQAGINPDKIVYSSLQKIIKPTTFNKDQLDAQRLAIVADVGTTNSLKAARSSLSAINKAL